MNMNGNRILLAIDPFEKGFKPARTARLDLQHWLKRFAKEVEAVHVVPFPLSDPRYPVLHTHAFDALKAKVEELHLGVPVQLKVLHVREEGEHPSVELLRHADEVHTDLMIAASRGRRWITRLVMGSFAESLLLKSKVPMLFFGQFPDPKSGFDRVLFPTDFTESSRMAYRAFLEQMKPLQPELVILHVEQYPGMITGYSLAGLGAYLPESYWKLQKEAVISEGEEFVKLAEKVGIRARFLIEEGGVDVTAAIQRVCEEGKISLIGLSSVRSELDRMVMGSISTRLFRSNRYSVWVFGPGAYQEAMKRKQQSLPPEKTMGA